MLRTVELVSHLRIPAHRCPECPNHTAHIGRLTSFLSSLLGHFSLLLPHLSFIALGFSRVTALGHGRKDAARRMITGEVRAIGIGKLCSPSDLQVPANPSPLAKSPCKLGRSPRNLACSLLRLGDAHCIACSRSPAILVHLSPIQTRCRAFRSSRTPCSRSPRDLLAIAHTSSSRSPRDRPWYLLPLRDAPIGAVSSPSLSIPMHHGHPNSPSRPCPELPASLALSIVPPPRPCNCTMCS